MKRMEDLIVRLSIYIYNIYIYIYICLCVCVCVVYVDPRCISEFASDRYLFLRSLHKMYPSEDLTPTCFMLLVDSSPHNDNTLSSLLWCHLSIEVSQITTGSLFNSLICLQHRQFLSSALDLCDGNPPVTGGFSSQWTSNTGRLYMSWHHYLANLLVSQVSPTKPGTQSQRKPFTRSSQVAPFLQGFGSHSSMSEGGEWQTQGSIPM